MAIVLSSHIIISSSRIIISSSRIIHLLIIGKGASTLKEITAEFDVKIFVDREEYQNMRKVTLRSESEHNMQLAKNKILFISQTTVSGTSLGTFGV